jgi:hypothetical protein
VAVDLPTPAYRYRGQPPTPSAIRDLILELFAGRLTERRIIADEVLAAHLARGGCSPRAQDFPRSVKKALSRLQDEGFAENPSHGYWRITTTVAPGGEGSQSEAELLVPSQQPLPAESEPIPPVDLVADVILGEGPGAVYLYYLPTYRATAEERGESVWPCKIGRTERDPLTRVLSQAATAFPERPRIAIVLRTEMPAAWESALHAALTLRGLQIEDSPGAEWFLTSPDDVLDLARQLDPRLEPPAD